MRLQPSETDNSSRRYLPLVLVLIVLAKLFLNLYGISWGLPDRWNIDEQVAKTLRMMAEKTYYSEVDIWHPTFYKLTLAAFMSPYLLYLKTTDYPLDEVGKCASHSWIKMAQRFPDFAGNIYINARLYSVLLGVLAVILVYVIGKLFHSQAMGICSAAVMASSSGLVVTNHFAKSDSLVLVLNLLVFLFCLRAIKLGSFKRNLYLAAFFSGLATATKFDGAITVFYILSTYFIFFATIEDTEPKIKNKAYLIFKRYFHFDVLIVCIGLFLSGLFIGWPVVFLKTSIFIQDIQGFQIDPTSPHVSVYSAFWKLTYSFLQIIKDFNILISAFIMFGFIFIIISGRKFAKSVLIFLPMLPIYFIFMSIFLYPSYHYSATKLVIQSFPALSIFGGIGLYSMFKSRMIGKYTKLAMGIMIVVYSSYYVLRADQIFAMGDTRYQSTRWVLENIPPKSFIEHMQDADWLFSSSRILEKYHVIYYGRDSQYFKESFYKFSPSGKSSKSQYIDRLNSVGSEADYFIIARGLGVEEPNSKGDAFYGKLISGKTDFKLIKGFETRNSFLTNPVSVYLSLSIYMYKREKYE